MKKNMIKKQDKVDKRADEKQDKKLIKEMNESVLEKWLGISFQM